MSSMYQQPPHPAQQAFDEAMHHLSELLQAKQKLDTSMAVLRSHLSGLVQNQQQPPGGGQ